MIEKERNMKYYKATNMIGTDKRTGKISYFENIGKTVTPLPTTNTEIKLCSSTVLHACKKPIDLFTYCDLKSRFFEVEGKPVISDKTKSGFKELKIIREIPKSELDKLFGFKYNEALNPLDPRKIDPIIDDKTIQLLEEWILVRNSVRDSVWDSIRASVRVSVRDSVWDSVRWSVWDSVWDSIWDSVGDSVRWSVWGSVRWSVWDSEYAYIGSLFRNIKKWKHTKHTKGEYPFQSGVELLQRGVIPIFDGTKWHLFSAKEKKIVYTRDIEE